VLRAYRSLIDHPGLLPYFQAASPLEEIPGVGAGRKKALLSHFGSARGVAQVCQSIYVRKSPGLRTILKAGRGF